MNTSENSQSQNPSETENINPKRNRSVSVSGRLRSASILFETGKISYEDRNSMKDLILCQDPLVEQAFIEYEAGDETNLLELVHSGYLQKKSEFAFLDIGSDLGLGSLSLNTLSDDNTDSSSMFAFPTGLEAGNGLIGDSLPDELMIDDIDNANMGFKKRGRDSVDFTNIPGLTVTDDITAERSPQDHFNAPYAGYNGLPGESPYVADNPDYMMIPQSESSYSYQMDNGLHTEGIDYALHLDPLTITTQDTTLLPGVGTVDTSMLTLSSNNRDERRVIAPGLTPINTQAESQKKYIGIYSPESRKKRVQRFFEKRKQRVWTKKVKYDVRKNFADSRLRVKGRFVKKEDEELLRELMNLT